LQPLNAPNILQTPPTVQIEHWGLIDYEEAWRRQEILQQSLIQAKLTRREGDDESSALSGHLIFCEHPHVFTLGRNGKADNMLATEDELRKAGASLVETNRGGDITYHGPGQLICYPIFDLEYYFTDLHRYMRALENAVIQTIASYGIKGEPYPGFTGVWVEPNLAGRERKICAMGVRTSRWVTMHGLALNVNPDLAYFDMMVPCGIEGKAVTSISGETGLSPTLDEVAEKLTTALQAQFGFSIILAN
jgi:lipoyl(octanoyl) transferase